MRWPRDRTRRHDYVRWLNGFARGIDHINTQSGRIGDLFGTPFCCLAAYVIGQDAANWERCFESIDMSTPLNATTKNSQDSRFWTRQIACGKH
jgi:hypothetical protein